MRPPLTWPRWVAAGIACVVLVAGCSTETKQHLLRVFFTGVDETNASPVVVAADKLGTNAPAGPVTTLVTVVVYMHKPYLERKCDACHLAGQSEELRATGSALCLECHAKLIENAQFVHAPIRDGRCDLCHEAHKATERFLLTRKGQEVCLNCHKPAAMARVKGHAKITVAECLSCHDAHRSDRGYLLKTQQ